jgi:hypothetical protein
MVGRLYGYTTQQACSLVVWQVPACLHVVVFMTAAQGFSSSPSWGNRTATEAVC